jgi:hypothetical protein
MANLNNYRRALFSVVLGILLITVFAGVAGAANIRGRLERRTPQGLVPAQGVPVTVFRSDIGRSAYSYSGYDGMYYISNIPDGAYTLEVWAYPNSPPLTFTIRAVGGGITDIAPIVI